MRQPKFKMGANVTIPLAVSHTNAGFVKTISVQGVVAGVGYDPKCGTDGRPWYNYAVLPLGGSSAVTVCESDVTVCDAKESEAK